VIGQDRFSLRYVDYLPTEGLKMFEYAKQIGMEGVVAKKADAIYKGGVSRQS